MTSEERLHIAIAASEKDTLWPGHFGMAPVYWIYDQQGSLLEKRPNPYGARRGEKHEHHDDPQRIVRLLADCKIFIGKRMGETSRRKLAEKLGVAPILIPTAATPQEALQTYLAQDD